MTPEESVASGLIWLLALPLGMAFVFGALHGLWMLVGGKGGTP